MQCTAVRPGSPMIWVCRAFPRGYINLTKKEQLAVTNNFSPFGRCSSCNSAARGLSCNL